MVAVTGPAPGSELTAEADEVEERSSAGVLHVAAIFASHMVLQRNKPNAVFGALDADCAGMEVVAQIRDFDGSMVAQVHAYASKDLKDGLSPWRVMLPAQPEGGPYTLRVTAGNDFLEFEDVLIGEVWLAGGQSNMELELRNSENAEAALENCADPLLRFYNVPKTGRHQPQCGERGELAGIIAGKQRCDERRRLLFRAQAALRTRPRSADRHRGLLYRRARRSRAG